MTHYGTLAEASAGGASVRRMNRNGMGQDAGPLAKKQAPERHTLVQPYPVWWSFERLCEAMDMPANSTARKYFDKLEKDHLLVRAPGFPPRRGRPRRYTAESCLRVLTGNV